jgi:hypothetical protein
MEPADFKTLVADFAVVHSQLGHVMGQARDLRKTCKEMQVRILAYMQEHNIDECALADSRLVRKHTKKTEGLKKEHIEGELKKLVGVNGVDQAVSNMYNRRMTDVQETLAVVKAHEAEPAHSHT